MSKKETERADDLIRNAEQAKWAEYLRGMEQESAAREQESAAREQESAAREPKTMAQIKEEVMADGHQPGDDGFGEAMRAKKSKYQEAGLFRKLPLRKQILDISRATRLAPSLPTWGVSWINTCHLPRHGDSGHRHQSRPASTIDINKYASRCIYERL